MQMLKLRRELARAWYVCTCMELKWRTQHLSCHCMYVCLHTYEQSMNHIFLKNNSPKCYVKSPTLQETFHVCMYTITRWWKTSFITTKFVGFQMKPPSRYMYIVSGFLLTHISRNVWQLNLKTNSMKPLYNLTLGLVLHVVILPAEQMQLF